jgi:hypothetical protein
MTMKEQEKFFYLNNDKGGVREKFKTINIIKINKIPYLIFEKSPAKTLQIHAVVPM